MTQQNPIYSPKRYDELVVSTFKTINDLARTKGGEYSGDIDRLANFRKNAAPFGVPKELVWAIYAGKHWDAIQTFVADLVAGKSRERSEPIAGRVDDLIVYLLLFKAMIDETQNPISYTERRAFTVPEGHEAVRDEQGIATGEIRKKGAGDTDVQGRPVRP